MRCTVGVRSVVGMLLVPVALALAAAGLLACSPAEKGSAAVDYGSLETAVNALKDNRADVDVYDYLKLRHRDSTQAVVAIGAAMKGADRGTQSRLLNALASVGGRAALAEVVKSVYGQDGQVAEYATGLLYHFEGDLSVVAKAVLTDRAMHWSENALAALWESDQTPPPREVPAAAQDGGQGAQAYLSKDHPWFQVCQVVRSPAVLGSDRLVEWADASLFQRNQRSAEAAALLLAYSNAPTAARVRADLLRRAPESASMELAYRLAFRGDESIRRILEANRDDAVLGAKAKAGLWILDQRANPRQ